MESYYEINVSLNGVHYFATAPRSMRGMLPAAAVQFARGIRARFPKSEGFEVRLTRWEGSGQGVAF